jgi:hypothetical protein
MPRKWLAAIGAAAVLAVLAIVQTAAPGGQTVAATPFLALSRVPVPEMPAQAAELVAAATELDRETTAAAVMRAVATTARPGVMPYVVSAICQRTPRVAGTVVATAIQLHPDDELTFCQAALCAAPDQVGPVVTVACTAAPNSFANVAAIAHHLDPSADPLILDSLTNALPAVKPYLDQASHQNGVTNFTTLLRQTVQLINEDGKGKPPGQPAFQW